MAWLLKAGRRDTLELIVCDSIEEISMSEIKVTVVKLPDRDNLMLRYIDPMTGKQKHKSAGTTNRKEAAKAAGKWEAELREALSGTAQDDLGRIPRTV